MLFLNGIGSIGQDFFFRSFFCRIAGMNTLKIKTLALQEHRRIKKAEQELE